MFGWLRRWILKGYLQPTDEKIAVTDEYFKRVVKEHADALRVADKINKANLLKAQTRELNQSLRDGLEDGEDDSDDDYEEEKEESLEGMLMDGIIKPMMQSKMGLKQTLLPASSSTENFPPMSESESAIRKRAKETLSNLSDEQLEMLAKKGLL